MQIPGVDMLEKLLKNKSKIPKVWRWIFEQKFSTFLRLYKLYYMMLSKYGPWEQEQRIQVAIALALYKLQTDEEPEIQDAGVFLYLRGKKGEFRVLKQSIKYTGPFTRGYRYVLVNVPAGTYTIIKIRKKKKKKKKEKYKQAKLA